MQSFITKIEQSPVNKLHAVIVLMAMLLAAQIQYIQHGWINPDSVLYFESARLFAHGQWKEAIQVWNWPLYPVLIAAIHKTTSLGIHTSAQVLNVLFFGLATFSFIQIIRLAGGRQLTIAAGALILFSSQYIVGDVLGMLMRDEGFWAFYLSGLAFFIRFAQDYRIKDAVLWQLCAIIATLFRIEGITYLVLLPTLFFFSFNISIRERIRYFFTSHSINIFLAAGLILIITLSGDLSIKNFGRLQEVFTLNLYDELTGRLFSRAKIMSDQVLGKYLEEFAVQSLLLTFVYAIVSKIISATGFINVILAGLTTKNRLSLLEPKAYSALHLAIIISLIDMALIITKVFVLSGRYVVGLTLLLLVLAAFYFGYLLQHLKSSHLHKIKFKGLIYAIIIVMMLGVIKNVLPKADGYNYMQDAATWINDNNTENAPVFYDETRTRFHAGAPFIGTWDDKWKYFMSAVENGSINQYHLLVINHSSNHPEREKFIAKKLPQFHEVRRFKGPKAKKSIVIYENTQPTANMPTPRALHPAE